MDCRTVHRRQEGTPGGMETEKEEGGGPFEAPDPTRKGHLYGHHRQDGLLHAVQITMRIWPFLFLTFLCCCLSPEVMGEYRTDKGERVKPVQIAPAIKQEVVYVAETTGTLVAEADADVSTEVDGTVKKVLFKEGDQAGEGQLLVVLHDERYRLKVEESRAEVRHDEADVELARKTLGRKNQLYEEGVVSLQEYDDALATANLSKASLETAQAALSLAEKDLKDTQIFAPFSGLIGADRKSTRLNSSHSQI